MKKTCVVVIPLHKENPSHYELVSFRQCYSVLGRHPIVLIAPEGLNLRIYREQVPELNVIYIDRRWLSDIGSYNKLKVSRYFYSLFSEYDYLLTYEPDAFVFRDEIEYWCSQGFDYIGAPWFCQYGEPETSVPQLWKVGNSGFSLRNIKKISQILKRLYYPPQHFGHLGLFGKLLVRVVNPYYRWETLRGEENYSIQRFFNYHEDYFFSDYVKEKVKDFTIPTAEEAIPFSMEVNPSYLYEINGKKLPFGCHAWWKHDLEFWKPFVEAFGHKLEG